MTLKNIIGKCKGCGSKNLVDLTKEAKRDGLNPHYFCKNCWEVYEK